MEPRSSKIAIEATCTPGQHNPALCLHRGVFGVIYIAENSGGMMTVYWNRDMVAEASTAAGQLTKGQQND